MRCGSTAAAIALCVILAAARADARTWRVERDGSGEFTTLQPALDGAAPGDTILIGPGRYTEFAPFDGPGGLEPTYAGVGVDNLTLRGTDRDAVIIGPSVASFQGFGPKGIYTTWDVRTVRIEQLTVENVRDGAYLVGQVLVDDCVFRKCDLGVSGVDDRELVVRRCRFEGNIGDGMLAIGWGGTGVEVSDCRFVDNVTGLDFLRTPNGIVSHCTFQGGRVGVQYEQGASGTVADCSFTNVQVAAAAAALLADLRLDRNVMTGGTEQIVVDSSSHISGTQNTLNGGSYATVEFNGNCTADFHGNDILKRGGWLVYADTYLGAAFTIDLQNNYWGLTDAAAIAAAIRDGNDDPSIHAVVEFEPFAGGTVPTAQLSIGELKARYQTQPAPKR
jgi:hypothetical protein